MSKLPNTPPSLKAWEDGWCEISLTDQKFTLIEEDSFLDLHFRSSLRNTLVVVANSIDNQLRNRGLDITDKEIFRYLHDGDHDYWGKRPVPVGCNNLCHQGSAKKRLSLSR